PGALHNVALILNLPQIFCDTIPATQA
ncbi:unnamed protein product, partial [Allacma fusca]